MIVYPQLIRDSSSLKKNANKCGRNDGSRKSLLCNPVDSVQDHQWMLKPLGEKMVEENTHLVKSTTPWHA